MRPSGRPRNKNRNNGRRPNPGNVINRVFDSSGPEGKVRGTPQQIIDKYQSLAHDSQLSGDRVSAENFQQHSEHYARLLREAQKEIAEKSASQESIASNSVKEKTQIVGDDLYVTNLERLKIGFLKQSSNSILIKLNQIGTVTETLEVIKFAQLIGFSTITVSYTHLTLPTKRIV